MSTVDILSNKQMRRYIGITVHFISVEKLHSVILRLQTIQKISPGGRSRAKPLLENFSIPWKNMLKPSQKTVRLPWCP